MQAQDVILGLLMKQPMSGYDIKQHFEHVFSFYFDASYGSIYPSLKKLEQEGYIIKEVLFQEGKPNKNLYQITEEGKKKFFQYLHSPMESDVIRSDFSMRLNFGEYAERSQVALWIKEKINHTQAIITHLEGVYEEAKAELTATQELNFQLGFHLYRGYMKVLTEGYQQLEEETERKQER